jgi:hypothetical protein
VNAFTPLEREMVSFPSLNEDTADPSDAVIDSLFVDPVYAAVGDENVVKDNSVRASNGSMR